MKMGAALRVQSPSVTEAKGTSRADKKQYLRMKEQAKRVLEHLSQISEPEQTRHIHDAAVTARDSISKLADDSFHGGLKGLYGQYDVDRRGRINYDDFCDSLVLSNAGVNRGEARQLASEMDKQKTGELDYATILAALDEVARDSERNLAAKKAATAAATAAAAAAATTAAAATVTTTEVSETKSEAPRRVQFFPEPEATVAASSSSSSSSSSSLPPPPPQPAAPLTFESMHNPAVVHVAAPPAAASAATAASAAPPAPPSLPLSAPQYRSSLASMLLPEPSNSELSHTAKGRGSYAGTVLEDHISGAFNASLSSMLMPPLTQAEQSHTSRGRGVYSGAVLRDHIAHVDGLALGPTESPARRMLGPGKVFDHNLESDEFCDLVRDGGIQGRRATSSPYWTDTAAAAAAGVGASSSTGAGAGAGPAAAGEERGRKFRTARRMRSSSAPVATSPKAKRPGTYYSYFYGNQNDSVAEVLASKAQDLSEGHLHYSLGQDDEVAGERDGAPETAAAASDEAKASDSSSSSRSGHVYESESHIEARLRENAVLTQVGGRFNYLGHILRQSDVGCSGYVNFGEFKTALGKAGVRLTDTQARGMYETYSVPVKASAVGHADGKALPITGFVDKMCDLAQRPDKAGLPGHDPEATRGTEERRIAKKVLHSLKRVADPMAVFKDLDFTNKGWIRPEQLRSGLTHIGAPLTENEFKILLEKVDANGDGKIEMHEFDALLHSSVADGSKTQVNTEAAIAANSRYSSTYRHNFALNHGSESEFDRFLDSRLHQQERKNWTRLQYSLQARPEQVLSAFSTQPVSAGPSATRGYVQGFTGTAADAEKPDSRDTSALRSLDLDDLSKALGNAGVALGGEDARLLKAKLLSAAGEGSAADGRVSLQDFCEAVSLRVNYTNTGSSTRVAVSQPWETHEDGGVFCGATASHHGNDTVASSMFRRGEEGNVWVKGNCRRKAPVQHPELAESPHKWIDMAHGATGDLWPTHPRGETFFRGSLETNPKIGSRAVASPRAKSMRRMSNTTHKNESNLTSFMGDHDRLVGSARLCSVLSFLLSFLPSFLPFFLLAVC